MLYFVGASNLNLAQEIKFKNQRHTSLGLVRPMRHRSKCVRSAEVPDTYIYIVLVMCLNISFLIILENVLLLSSNFVGIGYPAS